MIKYIKYLKYIFLFVLIVILFIYSNYSNNDLTIDDVDNLMIVAHKEDGLIWGANNLVKDNYLVVCITCNNKDKDFIKIMKKTNNMYVLLNYDENTDFYEERNILNRDIKRYLYLKKWKKIVTHNPEGEYGSSEHITINNYVNKLLDDKSNLYYFNKYYNNQEIDNNKNLYKLNDNDLDFKLKLLSLVDDLEYVKEFKHILPYEEFISYKDWGDNNE